MLNVHACFCFWWHVLSMQDIHYSFTKSNSLRFAVLQNRSWSLIDDQTRWMQHLTAAAIHYRLIQQPVNCLGQRCALSLTTTTAIKHHTDHTQCHHHHHHHSITIGSCFNYRPSCRARFIRLRFDGHSTAYQRSLRSPGRTHHDLFISLFRSQLRLWCRSSSGRDVYSYCSWMGVERRSNCRTTQVESKTNRRT